MKNSIIICGPVINHIRLNLEYNIDRRLNFKIQCVFIKNGMCTRN